MQLQRKESTESSCFKLVKSDTRQSIRPGSRRGNKSGQAKEQAGHRVRSGIRPGDLAYQPGYQAGQQARPGRHQMRQARGRAILDQVRHQYYLSDQTSYESII